MLRLLVPSAMFSHAPKETDMSVTCLFPSQGVEMRSLGFWKLQKSSHKNLAKILKPCSTICQSPHFANKMTTQLSSTLKHLNFSRLCKKILYCFARLFGRTAFT